jgi:hypothetical protein
MFDEHSLRIPLSLSIGALILYETAHSKSSLVRRIEGSPNFRRVPLEPWALAVDKKGKAEYICGSGMPTLEGCVTKHTYYPNFCP